MIKILSRLALAIVVLTIILSVVLFSLLSDPNQYKEDIESALARAGVNVNIRGDLAWSFTPLSIEANKVAVLQQNGDLFTELETLAAQVEMTSLVPFEFLVSELSLSGIHIDLVKDADGETNWSQVIVPPSKTASEQVSDTSESGSAINIAQFSVTDSSLTYRDETQGKRVDVKQINLQMSDLKFDEPFPLALTSFILVEGQPSIDLAAKGMVSMKADHSSVAFTSEEATANIGTIESTMNVDVAYFPAQPSAHLKQLKLTTAGSFIEAKGFLKMGEALDGTISINANSESVHALLNDMTNSGDSKGTPPVVRLNSNATLKFAENGYLFKPLILDINENKWWGEAQFSDDNQAIDLKLNGGELNIKEFLSLFIYGEDPDVRSSESNEGNDPSAPLSESQKSWFNQPLNVAWTQSSIKYDDWQAYNAKFNLKVENGTANWDTDIGIILGGNMNAKGEVRPEGETLVWKSQASAFNLNAFDSIETQEVFGWELSGQGLLNTELYVEAVGHAADSIKQSLSGLLSYSIESGALVGANFEQLGCEAVARINRMPIEKTDWESKTDIDVLAGEFVIDGLKLTAQNTELASQSYDLSATGDIDLAKQTLDMALDLSVSRGMGDPACAIRYDLSSFPIPIECKGSFGKDSSPSCQVNTPSFDTIVSALEERIDQEVDQGINKLMDKYSEEYQFDQETADTVRELIKSIVR